MGSTDLLNLKDLLMAVKDNPDDPSIGEAIHQRFHPQEHLQAYLGLLYDTALPYAIKSLVLKVVYVAAKKWQLPEAFDGLTEFIARKETASALRTQALLHLIRLDLSRARWVVEEFWPQFRPLISDEHRRPTISGDPSDPETPFEEACLNHLYSERSS